MKLYRFTTNGRGVWSEGKRLLPTDLIEEVNTNRKWLKKPDLPEGDYIFYLNERGKEKYLASLYKTHQKYLKDITETLTSLSDKETVVYEDEHQVVVRAKT